MRLLLALVLHALVAILVVAPAFRDPPRDDFPLSNYPMFSERKDPRVTIQQVVARAPGGPEVVLPPRFVANEEVMQAAATIRRAMSAGPAALSQLCSEVSERVGRADDPELGLATQVEIYSRRFHAVKYFSGDTSPEHEETLARCQVAR